MPEALPRRIAGDIDSGVSKISQARGCSGPWEEIRLTRGQSPRPASRGAATPQPVRGPSSACGRHVTACAPMGLSAASSSATTTNLAPAH